MSIPPWSNATSPTGYRTARATSCSARRGQAIQAVLSPAYTPITNADVLQSARGSLNLSSAQVTVYRGHVWITGVSESVAVQPPVGDVISDGWELTNNEFGKGVLAINQFLPR